MQPQPGSKDRRNMPRSRSRAGVLPVTSSKTNYTKPRESSRPWAGLLPAPQSTFTATRWQQQPTKHTTHTFTQGVSALRMSVVPTPHGAV